MQALAVPFAGNLDPMVTETEMRQSLEERCGPVSRTNLLEGNSGGYGEGQ